MVQAFEETSVIMAAELKQATKRKRDSEKLVKSEGFVSLSTQKTLLNYLQVREKPSSSAKTSEGDELFFPNQQKLQASNELCHLSKHL